VAKTLIVEGWRFLPHSYAVVNQWQLLALKRRGDVEIKFVDMPYYNPRCHAGLFDKVESQRPDPGSVPMLAFALPFLTISRHLHRPNSRIWHTGISGRYARNDCDH
jgi:hypothetical protein